MNLFAELATKRLNREIYTDAQTAAVGSAVGFTGKADILSKLAQDLGLKTSGSGNAAVPASLRSLLMNVVKTTREKRKQQSDGN